MIRLLYLTILIHSKLAAMEVVSYAQIRQIRRQGVFSTTEMETGTAACIAAIGYCGICHVGWGQSDNPQPLSPAEWCIGGM